MSLFAKILSTIRSPRRCASGGAVRTRMVLEPFERRILHSADLGAALLHDVPSAPQAETRVIESAGDFAPAATQSQQAGHELVLVDTRTPDYQVLVDDVRSEASDGRFIDVVLLDSQRDGIAQITALLASRHDISAVHIISHGSDGAVQLGSTTLDLQSLETRIAEIGTWSGALVPGADLLIYGCDVAESANGRALIDALARTTSADVAASEDPTGAAASGGDWNLEYATGRIDTTLAMDVRTQQAWSGVLALTNNAPVLSGAENLNPITEDPATNPGTQVSTLIASHITDPDVGALSGIAVTGADNANGTWQYSMDAGGTWSNFGNPSDASARLLRSGDFVRFVPNADFNGTVNNGLTFRAWDQTTGTAGGTASALATTSTVLDKFDSPTYTNNDGTTSWNSGWVDSDGSASGGAILISGQQLELKNLVLAGASSIYRSVDLTGATSATLTLDYDNQILLNLLGDVSLQISGNGGTSYATLATFSSSSTTGASSLSFNITGFISADTRVQLVVSGGITVVQSLFIDNVQISYDTPLATGRTAFSGATASSGITVSAVNDPPAGTDKTVTVAEDGVYTFSIANFGFTDTHDSPPDNFSKVTIATLPGAGSLKLNGVAVTGGQPISVADITAGLLQFTPGADGNGIGYTSFTFQVQDDGGGADLDPTARTMTIDVTAVNDAPAGTSNTVATAEDTAHVFTTADFGFTDPSDAPANNFLAVKIGAVSGGGALTLNGIAVTAGQFVSATDITAGKLVFTPGTDANGAGYAAFTFQVQDDGGGTDLDPTARTMTIDVTAVNDPPSGASNTVTASEDTGYVFGTADFGFSDPDDTPANSLLAVRITTLPGVGSLTLSGTAVTAGQFISAADIIAGNLVFTPAADANGAGHASFTFQVQDSGGGADLDPTPRTMTVDVTAVNDAPVLATNTGASVSEGGSVTITTAALHVTDVDNGASQLVFSITSAPANGRLELTSAAGIAISSFTEDDIDNNRVVYVHDGSETATDGFTFSVSDGAGGAIGPTAFSIAIVAVNNAPTNSVPAAQSTVQDAPLVFSTSNGNAIAVADSDAAASAIQVTLSATNGTLTLATTAGITFVTGTGNADTSMQFTGTVAAINAALNGMAYNPDAGFIGNATVSVVTDDLGNTGSGGALTATGNVNISVLVPPPTSTNPTPPVDPTAPGVPSDPTTLPDQPDTPTAPPPSAGPPTALPVASPPPAGGNTEPAAATPPLAEPPLDSGRSLLAGSAVESTRIGRFERVAFTLPAAQWLMFGDDMAINVGEGSASSIGLGGIGDGRNALQSPGLLDALDRLREGLQEQSRAEALVVATTTAATLGLSVGYVLWLLRGGVLLSSMLSSLPAWRLVDPLPVLGRLEEDDEEDEDESLESMVASRNATPTDLPRVLEDPAMPPAVGTAS